MGVAKSPPRAPRLVIVKVLPVISLSVSFPSRAVFAKRSRSLAISNV